MTRGHVPSGAPADRPAAPRAAPACLGLCTGCGRAYRLDGGGERSAGAVLACPRCGVPVPFGNRSGRKRQFLILTPPSTAPLPDQADLRPGESAQDLAPVPLPAAGPIPETGTPQIPTGRDGEPAASEALSSPEPAFPGEAVGSTLEAVAPASRTRHGGLLFVVAGGLLGLLAGAGLLMALSPGGILEPDTWLGVPFWVLILAAVLPNAGLAAGLFLAYRRR